MENFIFKLLDLIAHRELQGNNTYKVDIILNNLSKDQLDMLESIIDSFENNGVIITEFKNEND